MVIKHIFCIGFLITVLKEKKEKKKTIPNKASILAFAHLPQSNIGLAQPGLSNGFGLVKLNIHVSHMLRLTKFVSFGVNNNMLTLMIRVTWI